MDLGKLYSDDSFVIGSNQALFVNDIVKAVKKMLGEVRSSDDVHDRIWAQHIVPQQKVFISFGGHDGDIRPGFIYHLQAGLERSGINFYINIENMTKGYDIEKLITNLLSNWGATDARIDRWKHALNSVGHRVGLVSANLGSEARFVESIIDATTRMLANTSSS
ncbi:Uncharacterized protein Rs2_32789 [Raphanus sativus]|nr:Uncharacterized protein Rs2_32789 [Raphanus sativus]